MVKAVPKLIGVTERPILIVGEKLNTQRPGYIYALEGNRTGDYVHEAIGDKTNIILSNVVNELYKGNFDHKHPAVAQGILELIELIETHQPSKIICLGGIARDYVLSLKPIIPSDCKVVEQFHPSWVNRFKSKYRSQYIKQLSDELEQRVSANT